MADDGTINVVEQEIKGTCKTCGGNLIEKRGRFGRFSLAATILSVNIPSLTRSVSCPWKVVRENYLKNIKKKRQLSVVPNILRVHSDEQ